MMFEFRPSWNNIHDTFPTGTVQDTITLSDLEPAGTASVSGNCNSHLALFTTERQREFRPEMTFTQKLLKTQVYVN